MLQNYTLGKSFISILHSTTLYSTLLYSPLLVFQFITFVQFKLSFHFNLWLSCQNTRSYHHTHTGGMYTCMYVDTITLANNVSIIMASLLLLSILAKAVR